LQITLLSGINFDTRAQLGLLFWQLDDACYFDISWYYPGRKEQDFEMRIRQTNLILMLLAALLVLSLIVIYPSRENENSGNRELIAIVNGKEIFAGDVQKITKMIDVMNLHQLSAEQLRLGVQKHRINTLLNDIKQTIIEQNIKKYGITVSEQEVNAKIEEIFANIDPNAVRETIEKSNASYEALKEWQKNTSESDSIYNEKLAEFGFRIDQWELLQITYDTPRELQKMQVPKNIEDMKKNSYESIKNDLLLQKLIDKVTKATVTEVEIREAYNLKYGDWNHDAPFEEVKEKIREQLKKENQTVAMTIWLNEQYKNANIKIKDPKFNEILDILQTVNK
jgi:hypothetical protein